MHYNLERILMIMWLVCYFIKWFIIFFKYRVTNSNITLTSLTAEHVAGSAVSDVFMSLIIAACPSSPACSHLLVFMETVESLTIN